MELRAFGDSGAASRAFANCSIGRSRGIIARTRHLPPASAMKPVSIDARRPARTKDDLPQPDGPITGRKWVCESRRSKSSVCLSRPKKMSVSSV